MAYYATQALQPINGLGAALGQDVLAMPEGGCPKGYHPGNLTAGGVSVQTPVCVKRSFTALHLVVAGIAGVAVGKLIL